MKDNFTLKELLILKDKDKMVVVGDRIRDILSAKGIRQREISDKLGICDSDFSRKMNADRCFTKDQMLKVIEILGVSKDYLFYGSTLEKDIKLEKLDEDVFKPTTRMEKVLLAKINEIVEYLRVLK